MFVEFWMVQRLTREIHSLETKMMYKHIELEHLQKYAGRLGASSNLNISNIAGLSSDLLGRATMFGQYADQASSMSAMQTLQMLKATGRIPVTGNMTMQMQIETSAYNQCKAEALKALKQQEVQVMNEKEKELQLEFNSIQQELEMKKQNLETCKRKLSDDIKASALKFGL